MSAGQRPGPWVEHPTCGDIPGPVRGTIASAGSSRGESLQGRVPPSSRHEQERARHGHAYRLLPSSRARTHAEQTGGSQADGQTRSALLHSTLHREAMLGRDNSANMWVGPRGQRPVAILRPCGTRLSSGWRRLSRQSSSSSTPPALPSPERSRSPSGLVICSRARQQRGLGPSRAERAVHAVLSVLSVQC